MGGLVDMGCKAYPDTGIMADLCCISNAKISCTRRLSEGEIFRCSWNRRIPRRPDYSLLRPLVEDNPSKAEGVEHGISWVRNGADYVNYPSAILSCIYPDIFSTVGAEDFAG